MATIVHTEHKRDRGVGISRGVRGAAENTTGGRVSRAQSPPCFSERNAGQEGHEVKMKLD